MATHLLNDHATHLRNSIDALSAARSGLVEGIEAAQTKLNAFSAALWDRDIELPQEVKDLVHAASAALDAALAEGVGRTIPDLGRARAILAGRGSDYDSAE